MDWVYAAVTQDGQEFSFDNEFQAFDKLNALGVAGRVEYRSGVTGEITVRYARGEDGRWSQPPQPPLTDDVVDELLSRP